jgi:hypothetical protein
MQNGHSISHKLENLRTVKKQKKGGENEAGELRLILII